MLQDLRHKLLFMNTVIWVNADRLKLKSRSCV